MFSRNWYVHVLYKLMIFVLFIREQRTIFFKILCSLKVLNMPYNPPLRVLNASIVTIHERISLFPEEKCK